MTIAHAARRALQQRIEVHRQHRWPDLARVDVRYRGDFVYLDAAIADDDSLRLCRLRWLGSPNSWGFAIYLASGDRYQESVLPTGAFTGTPEQALDCACGLYLNDPTAWATSDTPNTRENL